MALTIGIVAQCRLGPEWENKQGQCSFSYFSHCYCSVHFQIKCCMKVSKINFQPDKYSKCATSRQCPQVDIHSCLLVMRSVRYVMCNCETKCFVDELGFWWRMMCFVNAIYSAGGQVRSDKVHCLKEVSGLTDCQIIRSMTKGEKELARKKK